MQTVQIKLLSNGSYLGGENVDFPVIVTGNIKPSGVICNVHHDELHRVGFIKMEDDTPWPFYIGSECEVVS